MGELADATFTVAQLNELVRLAFEVSFPEELWVEGEIASLSRRPSGHVYFQLVDGGEDGTAPVAAIDVVLFDRARREVNAVLRAAGGSVRMSDGVHLRVRGRLDYWPAQGRVRLLMSGVDPEHTLGRLGAERDRVLAALAAAGLLEANRSLPFPAAPHRVGLVTSPGSAAHADFVHELERSRLGWQVVLAEARMQGRHAERSVVAALAALEARGVEVVAVVRGGGARTDLATFDTELLARAIAGAGVPVVTGIGHETDTSVADAVAARAFKTPTACAAGLVEQALLALGRADEAWSAVARRATVLLDHQAERLDRAAHRAGVTGRLRLAMAEQQLAGRSHAVRQAAGRVLDRSQARLDVAGSRLATVDPARALARGWSITRTADGRVLRDPARVRPGDELLTEVAGGRIRSTVRTVDGVDDAGAPTQPEGAQLP